MEYTLTDPGIFDLNAGALCLAFANTADWHASDHPEEQLNSYADLVLWAKTQELISEGEAVYLWKQGNARPEEAAAILAQAIQLREALYGIFTAIVDGEAVPEADLEILNATLPGALVHLQIASLPDGFLWQWKDQPEALDRMLWPVVHSATELLTSGRLDRIGRCADDRGCGWLFLDTSRNRSRRWCSMESCGNRAKALRHYDRQRQSGDD